MQHRAFRALSLKKFRYLFEFDRLKYLTEEYNHVEFMEIYKYTDLNTVLKFAVLNNLINIARRAARDGGQFCFKEYDIPRMALSRDIAEFILERHTNPRLHMSDIVISNERNILASNAIVYNNRWLLNRLGIDFNAQDIDVLNNYAKALITAGDAETIRRLVNRGNAIERQRMQLLFKTYALTPNIGMSGKREMYELMCEFVLGPGITIAIPANHQDRDKHDDSISLNSAFVYGALYNGHFDVAREIMNNEEIQFQFDARLNDSNIFGASKYCIHILTNMRRKLVAKGLVFDIPAIYNMALKNRRIDTMQFIEKTYNADLRGLDPILDVIESSSTEMVRHVLERYRYARDDRDMREIFGISVIASNNMEMIMLFMSMGATLDMGGFDDIHPGMIEATENTVEFVLSNITGVGRVHDRLHGYLAYIFANRARYCIDNMDELFYRIIFAPNVEDVQWHRILREFRTRDYVPTHIDYEFFINVMNITPDDMETVVVAVAQIFRRGPFRPFFRVDDFAVAARYAANENMDKFNQLMLLAE